MAGDSDIGGAIVKGMQTANRTPDEARLGVRTVRYERDMREKIEQAQEAYGDNPRHCFIVRLVIGLYGLVLVKIDEWYKTLAEWNRS